MFGQNNNQNQPVQDDNQPLAAPNGFDPSTAPVPGVPPTDNGDFGDNTSVPPTDPITFGDNAGAPPVDNNFGTGTTDAPLGSPTAADEPAPGLPALSGSDDLLNIKQEALQHLNPLVTHLDQSPEEKFRTVMMMIQASDDQSKLKEAFDAAKAITDDKVRAQALLDVINEINYFTQQANK